MGPPLFGLPRAPMYLPTGTAPATLADARVSAQLLPAEVKCCPARRG